MEFPISIEKAERPDFRCKFGPCAVGIEVSEATDRSDQEAMTKFQQSGAPIALVGSFGGRFPRVAGSPELSWQEDVLGAVRSKSQDFDSYTDPLPEYALFLYSNSNAASHIHDELWPRVFAGCDPMNEQIWEKARSDLKRVAVICGPWLLMLEPGSVLSYPVQSGVAE
jgi:hypothetical protein